MNNDILIPRSILKRNEMPPKPQVDLDDFEELLNDAEQIATKEAIVGKQIDMNGPMISPRLFNQNYLENLYRKMEMRDQVMYLQEQEQQPKITMDHGQQKTTSVSLAQEEDKSKSPPKKKENRDLVVTEESLVSKPALPAIKKTVIRKAKEDGFFKTGVEVIEQEEYEFEGTAQDAVDALKEGKLTAQQIRELLQKKLKDDKIFGFDNYSEFNSKYFKKELVAFEEFHKIRQLKYARVKYNNRNGTKKNTAAINKEHTGYAETSFNTTVTQLNPHSPDKVGLNNNIIIQMMETKNRLAYNDTEQTHIQFGSKERGLQIGGNV